MTTDQKEMHLTEKKDSGFALMRMDSSTLKQVIADNLGPQGFGPGDLDRVKIPAGGGRSWNVPSLEGDKEEREIQGIIIHWADRRVYWEKSFSGEGAPPDCYSEDTVTGVGSPGGLCDKCPLSEFGTAKSQNGEFGKGQACKQIRQIFVSREDGGLVPLLVTLPPTSLAPVRKYFLRLASSELPYWGVVTKLTLEKTKNSGGIEFSRVDAAMGRRLSPEELRGVEQYRNAIRPALDRAAVEATDYAVINEDGPSK